MLDLVADNNHLLFSEKNISNFKIAEMCSEKLAIY